ncbi:MAG: phosphate/phosphite/phosphonate ABC transporter substrate-binding protein [Phycisphaerae bacterium]|nr:phosphate/phosphite/phosphonate ABC transporter substrate-binding protein [Phycisphaerae bacterium]
MLFLRYVWSRVRSCYHWRIVFLLFFATGQASCPGQAASSLVRIGVFSNHGYGESILRWSDTAEYLSDHIPGYHFIIYPFSDSDVKHVITEPKVEFVISCPSEYIRMEVLYGVARIATMKTKYQSGVYDMFSGVLFWNARNDQIRNLEDLKGKN